jgi:signal peptidase II
VAFADPVKARAAAAAALLALVLDLASKRVAMVELAFGELREVTSFFSLVLVENRGAAFSLFSGTGEGQGLKMTALSALALLPLAWFYRQARREDLATLAALGSILGGALGNIHDRLRYGAVVDFLDFHWGGAHWPAFNLADVFVVAGVLWILGGALAGAFAAARPGSVPPRPPGSGKARGAAGGTRKARSGKGRKGR